MNKRGPTKPNRTGESTPNDRVMTPSNLSERIVKHFAPKGVVLEPCKGSGNFYNHFPKGKEWCEIDQGRDFFKREKKADWIITNPPFSIYDKFLEHCLKIADNVVVLVPLAKTFKSVGMERLVDEYGGLKEVLIIGAGNKAGFKFGFLMGCLYFKRDYKGTIKRTWLDG